MTISELPILSALAGGALIGLSAVLLWLSIGKIAGISGILGNLISRPAISWQGAFILGLVISGLIYQWLWQPIVIESVARWPLLIVAGLLVGFGSRLGNGCTSGHGVCGMARLSKRSIVATLTFMSAGIVTVLLINTISG